METNTNVALFFPTEEVAAAAAAAARPSEMGQSSTCDQDSGLMSKVTTQGRDTKMH